MKSTSYLPQLLTVFLVSAAAAAQSPWGFPLEQRFVATSINGQSIDTKPPTLTIMRNSAQQQALVGAGFAGCNSWNGEIMLNQSRFGVGGLGTTKMFCADQMAAESSFLAALKAVKRWHMDGATLVLQGDNTTLLLTPAEPTPR